MPSHYGPPNIYSLDQPPATDDPVYRAFSPAVGQLTDPRSQLWAIPRGLGSVLDPTSDISQQFGQQVMTEGFFPTIGSAFDRGLEGVGLALRPVGEFFFGPPEQPGNVAERTPTPAGTPIPVMGGTGLASPEAGAAFGFGDMRESKREFTSNVPLPATGEEAFPEKEFPRMERETVEKFIADLEGIVPEEFKRDPVSTARLLAGIGEGLMGAHTMGEALLGAGTGGTRELAEHQAEQDELARAHAEARRRAQLDAITAAFDAERGLVSQAQQAMEFAQNRERLAVAQQSQRDMEIAKRRQVKVSGDNIIYQEPVMDEQGNFTNEVRTEIITKDDRQAIMDSLSLNDTDFLPDEVSERLGGLGVAGQANVVLAWRTVEGSLPEGNIPMEGARETLAAIKQNGVRNAAIEVLGSQFESSFGEGEEVSPAAIAQAADMDLDDVMDLVEDHTFKLMINQMARDPAFQASIWEASGNPVFAPRGALMRQRIQQAAAEKRAE